MFDLDTFRPPENTVEAVVLLDLDVGTNDRVAMSITDLRDRDGTSLSAVEDSPTASCLHLLDPGLARNEKDRLAGGRFAPNLEYRYGDSNPGFRTENPAS